MFRRVAPIELRQKLLAFDRVHLERKMARSGQDFHLEISSRFANSHDDFGPNSTIISRFFSRETAHGCTVVIPFAGRAESAFHQRRHEPVRADLSRPTKAVVASPAGG